ncbi:hypothetical protein [Streptomyces sp. NPDC060188]|uniref:hypothetical protein n=1 Tax=Streptomyces sp. NPDC060188 TaxID=3347068 RepID=UPI0036532211
MDHSTEPPEGSQGVASIPQLCCLCGEITRQPVQVDEASSPSGPVPLFACPEDARLFVGQQERAS